MLSVYFLVASLLPVGFIQGSTNFSTLANRAPIIAVGRITELGEPPAAWSTGGFMAAQKVKYQIVSVLKGERVGDEVTVYHYLFKDSPNSDKDRPVLSTSLFAVGNDHILFLRPISPDDGREQSSDVVVKEFAETNTGHGAVLANEDNLREVRKALSMRR